MGIKLNRTNKKNSISGLDAADARKVLTQKFLENMGGHSSCDPHGNAMYAQSYSAPAVCAPATWAVPQEESAWAPQPNNFSFEQQLEGAEPAPQQTFETESENPWARPPQHQSSVQKTSWAAPRQYQASPQQAEMTWYCSASTSFREFLGMVRTANSMRRSRSGSG